MDKYKVLNVIYIIAAITCFLGFFYNGYFYMSTSEKIWQYRVALDFILFFNFLNFIEFKTEEK